MPEEQLPGPKSKAARYRSTTKRLTDPGRIVPTSVDAAQAAKDLRATLIGMLNAAALMRANRRRETAIDRVDFEAAFDDLVNPSVRSKRLALIGDVCGIFGAGFIGYSINIYTGSRLSHQTGHIAILAGLILSVVGACLKYLDPS